MARSWMAFGMGGGDVPPMTAARDEAARDAASQGCGVVGAREVVGVDDLCRRAVEGRDALPACLWDGSSPLGIVAVRPRAVRALLRFAGAPLEGRDIRWVAAAAVEQDRAAVAAVAEALPDAADWVPWYPVLDAERCTRCGQCVRFCLFGVYEADASGLPVVTHPEKCKNLCPACARICPAAALIFPRYTESPFNGDDVAAEDADRLAARREDVLRLLGDDPVAALRDRQRRSAESRSAALVNETRFQEALAERERHLRREAAGEKPNDKPEDKR